MKTRKKRSFLSSVLFFFNHLAVLALLTVYAGSYISPAVFWPVAFAGLAYPLILIINVAFVVLWIMRLRPWFLLSLIAILIGWNHVGAFIQINKKGADLPGSGKAISVLSYNVRVFDLYNYGPNWELNFENRNNIFRFLEQKDFDIICFQEFVHDKSGAFKTLDTLPSFLRAKHAHAGYIKSSRKINFFGLATFSAYPIVNRGEIKFPTQMGNMAIYSDIAIQEDTIRVYNVHFESIGLSPEDYLFMETITEPGGMGDRNYVRERTVNILNRLRRAFIKRAEQVEIISGHIRQSPYPVILAGDFNDTPASWAYRQLTRELEDAFRSGRGIGQTYIGQIPGFRIDYILHSSHFTSHEFTTGNQTYSDHYPVWVQLWWE